MGACANTDSGQWPIGRLLNWTTDHLKHHGVEDARLASEVLRAHAAGCRRIDLYARFDQTLERGKLDRFRGWVRSAAAREPVAYLVGEKEFFSLAFRVTRDVLIPRPETEVLVESVLDHCAKAGLSQPQLLDVGTGSGCIAVTVLTQLQGARVVATDVSPAALEVARSNAERHGVSDGLTLVAADCLSLSDDVVPAGRFDLLVSNPPYVSAEGVADLDATVRDYEPAVALTDGEDGLSFYRAVATDAPNLLSSNGAVIVEVGDGQAASVLETVEQTGKFVHCETRLDRVVGQERVMKFLRSGDS